MEVDPSAAAAPSLLPAPLAGIRVLDFSRVLAGPYCTMMLGDLGADIVKVESPEGDDTRRWGPPYAPARVAGGAEEGESAYYLSCNRNKRGIVLDLSSEAGREIARALALRSDVLVENYRFGAMERWGLSYADLKGENPRLIYCSISGYGRTGPDAALPGYDNVVQAAGGVMSITGDVDGPPSKVGVAIVDLTAGMFALSSILAALRVADRTGVGQQIDISLFDSHLAWLANAGSNYLVSGKTPRRYGNAHPNIVPYQAFHASDGRHVVLAVGNDKQWARFCETTGRPDLLEDERFATNPQRVANRDLLVPMLDDLFASRSSGDWLALLRAHDVPCGPVNTVAEALESKQAAARGMVQEVEHPLAGPLRLVVSPLKLESTPPTIRRHPPVLGEHTYEVLRELLGLDETAIDGLRRTGAIR